MRVIIAIAIVSRESNPADEECLGVSEERGKAVMSDVFVETTNEVEQLIAIGRTSLKELKS